VLSAYADGIWSDTPRELELIIEPPSWMTWWFISRAGISMAAILFSIIRMLYRRKLEKKNQLLREQALIIEKQQAVEQERSRIASEMHDDLGAGLTTIRFLSEKALGQARDEEEKTQIRKISEHSNRLVQSMSETIWAMNARFDNAESLSGYLRRYASEYLEERGMAMIFTVEGKEIDAIVVRGEKRRNVFLVFKELLHNAVKYSGAERLDIRLIAGPELMLSIAESGGRGFDTDAAQSAGNGLYNCRKRMRSMDGSLELERTQDGMIAVLRMPLEDPAVPIDAPDGPPGNFPRT